MDLPRSSRGCDTQVSNHNRHLQSLCLWHPLWLRLRSTSAWKRIKPRLSMHTHVVCHTLTCLFQCVCRCCNATYHAGEGEGRAVSEEDYKAMYGSERCAQYHKGTVLLYQLGCWHRGTPVNHGYVRCVVYSFASTVAKNAVFV